MKIALNKRAGPRPARGKRRVGVTMVELMVAIAVLLITVGGAVSSEVASQRLIRTSADTSAAMADLQACMEQAMLLAPEDLPVAGSLYEAGQSIVAFEDLHRQGERIVATYPGHVPGGPIPDPLEIVLTISWNDHQGRIRTLQLASMKTR